MSRAWPALVIVVVLSLLVSGCNDVRRMRRARDVDGLVGLLSHQDAHVRIKAVDALGFVGDTRAIEPLIRACRDRDPYVREHAARNLGCDYHSSLGCTTAEPAETLVELLDDRDPFVRVEAVRSLGEHPLSITRESLERLAGDQRWEVRQAVAAALGSISSTKSRPVLETLLADREEQVSKEAQKSLEVIDAAARAAAARAELRDRQEATRDQPGQGDAGPGGPGPVEVQVDHGTP